MQFLTSYEANLVKQNSFSMKAVFGFAEKVANCGTVEEQLKRYNERLKTIQGDLDTALQISTSSEVSEIKNVVLGNAMELIYQYEPKPTHFDDERCLLGQGAFAKTFRVKSTQDNQLYAMKRAEKLKLQNSGIQFDGIQREVQILISLSHPNIVRYYCSFDSGERKQFYNIIMELADGGDLCGQVKCTQHRR